MRAPGKGGAVCERAPLQGCRGSGRKEAESSWGQEKGESDVCLGEGRGEAEGAGAGARASKGEWERAGTMRGGLLRGWDDGGQAPAPSWAPAASAGMEAQAYCKSCWIQ